MFNTMRTTLNLDDAVLASLKSLAKQREVSVGEAASELLRKALCGPTRKTAVRHGVRVFPVKKTAKLPDEALVKSLMEE